MSWASLEELRIPGEMGGGEGLRRWRPAPRPPGEQPIRLIILGNSAHRMLWAGVGAP